MAFLNIVLFILLLASQYDRWSRPPALVYCKFHNSQLYLKAKKEIAPAAGAVEYEVRTFNISLFSKNIFDSYPSEQSSAAWKKLNSRMSLKQALDLRF